MILVLDTNVLLRVVLRSNSQYAATRRALSKVSSQRHSLVTLSQNLVEVWSVATRPKIANGFGLTPAQADDRINELQRMFGLLSDLPLVFARWRVLVNRYSVLGNKVYDARIVATMLENALTHVITYNFSDFTRYAPEGIVAIDPDSI